MGDSAILGKMNSQAKQNIVLKGQGQGHEPRHTHRLVAFEFYMFMIMTV